MPAAIAARLGLKTSGGRLIADLVSYLRPRRLLLLLDNFEQVTGAAPLVAELLAAAPGLVILITSRAVLRLTGEHELRVPPLPVPPAGRVSDAADLLGYASVRLFVERARAAEPGFELTTRNAQAIAGICRGLDGLPLAIELAAARIRLLPPRALLARLDDRMSVLTAGPVTCPSGSGRCAAPWTGASACCPPNSGRCSPAWACSPARSACPPRKPSAATR